MSFAATRMQLEIIIISEVSQTEKDKHHIDTAQTCKQKKKKTDTNEFIYKTELGLTC